MIILSNDYSPWGTFTIRVYLITILGLIVSGIIVFTFQESYLVSTVIIPFIFFGWGMWKQNKELSYK